MVAPYLRVREMDDGRVGVNYPKTRRLCELPDGTHLYVTYEQFIRQMNRAWPWLGLDLIEIVW